MNTYKQALVRLLSEPYEGGMYAFRLGMAITENPYHPMTKDWERFRDGWREGQRLAAMAANGEAAAGGVRLPTNY